MRRFFGAFIPIRVALTGADVAILLLLIAILVLGMTLAVRAPAAISGPAIQLAPEVLPYYAVRSLLRMAAAYALSLLFSLTVGYMAATYRWAGAVILPVLDVLQSVPILSFLPVVALSLTAILPEDVAVELASIVLIFTSQVWNMTFSFYQSMITIPADLREVAQIFRLNPWLRFRHLELAHAAIPLIWNSMMSWAGGWFFLMAAETFTVGARDFRLIGLGTYLQVAAEQGDLQALIWGLGTLIGVIVGMDQLLWRPLLAWADKFRLEMVESDEAPSSWLYDLWQRAALSEWFTERIWNPLLERVDAALGRLSAQLVARPALNPIPARVFLLPLVVIAGIGFIYGAHMAFRLLSALPPSSAPVLGLATLASMARVLVAQLIALAWTVPLGVAVGMNRPLAARVQPLIQVVASIPATALFPVILLFLLRVPMGIELAAVALMLMGTQWYVLFNIIAGASALPRDLVFTTEILGIRGLERWRVLIMPAIFPYLITGLITASGGAWNATIVAEYVEFAGQTHMTLGLGALIAQATGHGDYPMLLAATLTMILTVVTFNRLVWRRLYALAAERFRMD
ncbi:ABC transporter permease [Thermoflexus sp.]|uniref:ABC transporter permease n=1 Tax=Thermoflexus sp. TaxID=1969742 RepID=UPI002ADE6E1B|nr:ABC transporter permease subunit [Thermoflexus sp.]